MEEAQDDCQSLSDTPDLTSWGITDNKTGEESVKNYTGGAGTTVSKVTYGRTLCRHVLKSCTVHGR